MNQPIDTHFEALRQSLVADMPLSEVSQILSQAPPPAGGTNGTDLSSFLGGKGLLGSAVVVAAGLSATLYLSNLPESAEPSESQITVVEKGTQKDSSQTRSSLAARELEQAEVLIAAAESLRQEPDSYIQPNDSDSVQVPEPPPVDKRALAKPQGAATPAKAKAPASSPAAPDQPAPPAPEKAVTPAKAKSPATPASYPDGSSPQEAPAPPNTDTPSYPAVPIAPQPKKEKKTTRTIIHKDSKKQAISRNDTIDYWVSFDFTEAQMDSIANQLAAHGIHSSMQARVKKNKIKRMKLKLTGAHSSISWESTGSDMKRFRVRVLPMEGRDPWFAIDSDQGFRVDNDCEDKS